MLSMGCWEFRIRTTTKAISSEQALSRPRPHHRQWRKQLALTIGTKRSLRFAVIGGNILLLAVVLIIVVKGSSTSQTVSQAVSVPTSSTDGVTNPLDQLSSADIAVSIANMTYLPEATAVKNQAESVNAELAVAPSENVVASKPQIVATALKSRQDITTYTTVSGDSVASVAAKFNITSNSLQWSNNLGSQTLQAGIKLTIPPINGIVYTVKAGDTPQSLAAKYSANVDQIIAFNDAEISGLQPGEQILIPNGQQAAPVATFSLGSESGGTFYASYGANGYDPGYCTWYVASRIAVPSNWGNASSWAYYAALSGWTVSTTPTAGAIAQTADAAGGQGHVAIVDAVSADGSQVEITDMNGVAGYDRVGTAWQSTSRYQHFITH
jgi:surface antigen